MKRASLGLVLAMWSVISGGALAQDAVLAQIAAPVPRSVGKPQALTMTRGASISIDLRKLPLSAPIRRELPDREDPASNPQPLPGLPELLPEGARPVRSAPAPSPLANFDGLDYLNWGAGHPPDTNGDVGPQYYIQTVNTSVGVYLKSTGVRQAAFTFDALMSQGNFGNLCDTDNFGDPVVVYDSFEDRWVLTDFAFTLDASDNVINPPGAYQCFAVSKTGNPLTGGWNFYSLHFTDGLNDYPKFGVWPDGLYMSANMFDFPATGGYQGPRVWALNKAQMYAGAATIQVVQFNAPVDEFTLLPANARLQTGTPPAGSPNYFSTVWQFTNAVSIYKFHVDWNSISLSSLTGPFIAIAPASWIAAPDTVPSNGASNETLATRLMVQNQYTNIGGVESVWNNHTVRGGVAGTAAPRWYQTDVTGGAVANATTQAATHTPDTAVNRYMGSLAVDRAGNMALGYTASSSTLSAGIRYAARLAGDPASTLPQTETSLIDGAGHQTGFTRWGDYSAMTLDPDGCTFWYTNEYFADVSPNWLTRIGSFRLPSCTPSGSGTLQGTVTAAAGGTPISGATISFGSRTTTTDGTGFYSFSAIPSGTYPTLVAGAAGYVTATANAIVVTDAATTTQNFSLPAAASNACVVDTTQADFQTGVPSSVDLTTSPGDVILLDAPFVDQKNETVTSSGFGITSTSWAGQTFTPAVTGQLTRVELDLFCNACTGTTPNLTVSIRATTGATPLPTGADLATATIAGFSSASGGFFAANFASPPTLTAGVRYAVIIRAVSNPSAGSYAYLCSCAGTGTVNSNPYTSGQRVTSSNSGSTWTADTTSGGRDLGFRITMRTGYASAGDQTSSVRDANPAPGYAAQWPSLAWMAATPANTGLKFQAAASDSPYGPFAFVGPDGSAATYFTTSGASLARFNGKRYLRYKAYLASTSAAATPVVHDVTTCFANAPTLSIDNLVHAEGDAGTTSYTFTVSLSAPAPAGGVTFDIATADGTATAPGDYTAKALTGQTIPAGGTTYTFTVLVNGDIAFEADETFFVNVTNIVGAIGLVTQGQGTILNDDTTANLSTTVTDAPDPVTAGNNLTWTITVNNAGPGAAASASVSDTLPAGTTFVSLANPAGWTCLAPAVGATGPVTCNRASFAVGNATFTLVAKVDPAVVAGAMISNTATASAATTDPVTGNESGTATTTVGASADLSATVADAPDPVVGGNNLTYTITVTNAGPSNAATATLLDPLPPGTTFVSLASPAGWSCTTPAVGAAGSVSCGAASLAVGSVQFTLVVKVAPGAGPTLVNAATASSATTDPNPGNGTGQASTAVVAPADLSTTNVDAPDPVTAGNNLTYTITVNNAGPGVAAAPTLADTLPAGTTFVSLTAAAGWTCLAPAVGAAGSVSCSAASLAVGNATFTLVVKVGAAVAAGTVLSNTATAASSTPDQNPGNESGTATTTVATAADLSTTNVDAPDPVTAGNNLTYAITVSNAGPSDASTATLSDTLPAGTTFVSLAAPGGWTCATPAVGAAGAISCSAPGLAAGGSAPFTLVVKVGAAVTAGTVLSNTATAASATTDPNPANNSGIATTTVAASADLAATIAGAPAPVTAGNNLTYTITVTNAGPSSAASAALVVPPVPNTTFVSLAAAGGWPCTTPAVGAAGTVNCGIPALGVGTATFTLVLKVDPSVAPGTVLTGLAQASSATTDPNPADNTGTGQTTVNTSADLATTNVDSPDPVTAGNNLTYTITVTNAGPSNAASVTLGDTLPAGTTFVSLAAPPGWSCSAPAVGAAGSVSCTHPSLAVGSAPFTLVVGVGPAVVAGTVLSNTAQALTTTNDPNPANNSSTATTTVATSADLATTNVDSPDPVTAGNNLTYTITVTNAGPSNAASAVLADTLPIGTTFVSLASAAGWSCTNPGVGNGGAINCTNGSFAVGSAQFTLVVKVAATVAAGTVLTDTAMASSATTDPNPANDSGVATTTVAAVADLSVTNAGTPDPVTAGNNLTYTITVTNAGPSVASAAALADTLPAGTTFVSLAAPGGWSCTTPAVGAGGTVSCTAAAFAPGSAPFTLVAKVGAGVAPGTVLADTATASSATTDPNPSNDSATANVTVAAAADLAVTNLATPDPVRAGRNLSYAIAVSNAGPSVAASATMSVTLPAGVGFVSLGVPAGWNCTTPMVGAAGPVSCTHPGLAAGGPDTFTLVGTLALSIPAGTVLSATATASSATADPVSANDSATATVISANAGIDIDANGHYDALTDGLLAIRYLFGLSGPSLISNAVAPDATRTSAADIAAYLDATRAQLDIDGNGHADALTDGLLLLRYLFGIRDQALINSAIGTGASRATATDIEDYIKTLLP